MDNGTWTSKIFFTCSSSTRPKVRMANGGSKSDVIVNEVLGRLLTPELEGGCGAHWAQSAKKSRLLCPEGCCLWGPRQSLRGAGDAPRR